MKSRLGSKYFRVSSVPLLLELKLVKNNGVGRIIYDDMKSIFFSERDISS